MRDSMAIAKHDSNVTLACFEAGGAEFAIAVEYVREIVRLTGISPLPNAPVLIEGVVDLRGSLIPIVDLARVLGRGRARRDTLARIVVVQFGDLAMGLWIDAALDVVSLDRACLEAIPELAMQAGYDAVSAMIRREGEAPVMILSIESLIESVYRSAENMSVVGGVA